MKYFNIKEFACKCGCALNNIMPELVDKLDYARGLAGIPFVINSACRCKNHNTHVGGKKDSSHLLGMAADIRIRSSVERYDILAAIQTTGITRIGMYPRFIHVDIDPIKPQKVIWVGR